MEAEIVLHSFNFKAYIDRRTGDIDDTQIEVGVFLEEFYKEIAALPMTNTGYLNLTIKKLFRPTSKGYTHKIYVRFIDIEKTTVTLLKKTNSTNNAE